MGNELFNITIIHADPLNADKVRGVKWHNVAFTTPAVWIRTQRSIRKRYPTVKHVNVYWLNGQFREQVKFKTEI